MKLRNGKTYYIQPESHQKNTKLVSIGTDKYKDIVNKTEKAIELNNKKIRDTLTKNIKSKIVFKPIINIDKYKECSICAQPYKKRDIICSCSIDNINKHSYHKQCLKMALTAIPDNEYSRLKRCPYCYKTIIYKNLEFVKIV